MARDEIAGIIPENEWQPELEKEVEYFYAIAEKPTTIYTKRHTPNKYPEKFKDKREETDYQMQEIKRLINGYDGLCGKGYGWLNYAKIRDPEKGKISPEFRAKQEEYFQRVQYLQENKGSGIVGFKRRRWGFSSVGAWDDYHDCITKSYYQIGANSKSENDSRKAFKHVKFIHQNMPEWCRPRATTADRRDFMEFAWYEKDVAGNRIKKGIESWISWIAPTDNGHEGEAYSKLRIDEAGKIDNLLTIWGYAEDCLMLNTRRVGLPIILGTVGDIDKDGKGLMELYMNNKAYDLERFAVYGYHGMIVDRFGNDMIKEAIRWIIYERKRRENTTRKNIEAFRQKYPLVEGDAFNQIYEGGVGDPKIINAQMIHLMSNPPEARVGKMKLIGEEPHFEPNPQGHVVIYELPQNLQNGYRAVLDPAEDDDVKKSRDSSDLGFTIAARPYGMLPIRLAAEYCHRPMKLEDAYHQFALLCKIYGCKITIEMNKGGWRAFKWFESNHPQLLELSPKAATNARGGVELRYGVKMNGDRKNQMEGLLNEDIEHNCLANPSINFVGMPSKKMLEQYRVFGSSHEDDDLAVSWGWQLVLNQSDKRAVKQAGLDTIARQDFQYQRINNVIQLVNSRGERLNRVNLPNHPLFRK